jgi:hypothetical protein
MVQYSVSPVVILYGQITAREYVDRMDNQVLPMMQTFLNSDAVFKDDSDPIHTAGTVPSWFEGHEGELQHLPWPEKSPGLNIVEPLWSVLTTWSEKQIPTSNISNAS